MSISCHEVVQPEVRVAPGTLMNERPKHQGQRPLSGGAQKLLNIGRSPRIDGAAKASIIGLSMNPGAGQAERGHSQNLSPKWP